MQVLPMLRPLATGMRAVGVLLTLPVATAADVTTAATVQITTAGPRQTIPLDQYISFNGKTLDG